MSPSFDGAVLRQARIAESNDPNSTDPTIMVLDRDSNGNGKSDRDEYLDAYVNNQITTETEFALLPEATGNIIEGTNQVEEQAQAVTSDRLLFQFNVKDYKVIDGSISITPSPHSFDREAGTITYQSPPSNDPKVTYQRQSLQINYVRNDSITRFGYNQKKGKWLPFPGSNPEDIGKLPKNGQMTLPEVKQGLEPRVVIGSPDSANGTLVPVTTIQDESTFSSFKQNPSSITTGEAVVFIETGDIQFEQSLIDQHKGKKVFAFRYNFFDFDESIGKMGVLGEDTLVLNPLPKNPDDGSLFRPLIRAGYGTYLDVSSSSNQTGQEDVVWDESTGRLTFQTNEFDGDTIYYDGVYINRTPIDPFQSTKLGTIGNPNPFQTSGISNVDLNVYDQDGLIIYIEETGEIIARTQPVDNSTIDTGPDFPIIGDGLFSNDDHEEFEPTHQIPTDEVQIFENNSNELELQFSFDFLSNHIGDTIRVGTADYLLEHGVTCRLEPTSSDPRNLNDVPDVRSTNRVVNEVIEPSIRRGAVQQLSQIPITDIPGYDDRTFFKQVDGVKENTLVENEEVIYNFDDDQIKWATRATNLDLITHPRAEFTLDRNHRPVHEENYTFELDEGQGFQTLQNQRDVSIQFDRGKIDFIDNIGPVLGEGAGDISGDILSTNEVEFNINPPPSQRRNINKPVLIVNEDTVYRVVEEISKSKIRVHQTFEESGQVQFKLLDESEVVFRYGLHSVDLSERVVYPRKIIDAPDRVPEGENVTFEDDGSTVSKQVLERTKLGTPVDDQGNRNALKIPSYFRDRNARFDLIRDQKTLTDVSPSSPSNADEYKVNRLNGDITFHQDMYNTYGQSDIIFKPHLSQSRPSGPVEVLARDRTIGLPNDINRSDLTAKVLMFEDQYTVQSNSSNMNFDIPFRSGQGLEVEYTDVDGNRHHEQVGFLVREKVNVAPGQSTFSFGQGHTLEPTSDVDIQVNRTPVDADINQSNKTATIEPLSGERRVTAVYRVLDAQGGEQTVSLDHQPESSDVIFEEGSITHTLDGDHRGKVEAKDIMVADQQAFVIQNVSYDRQDDTTTLTFQSETVDQLRNPDVFVTSIPVQRTMSKQITMEDNSQGDVEARFYANQQKNLIKDHFLLIDGDPYHIRAVSFDQNQNMTTVNVSTKLLKEYDDPSVEMTPFQVYEPDEDTLETQKLAISNANRDFFLMKFDRRDDGHLLEEGVDYTFQDSGKIRLNKANTDLPKVDEYWLMSYTARDIVEPVELVGNQFYPRFRSSYTYEVESRQGGYEGSTLQAMYSFRDRDSFFFRVTPLQTIATEVQENIGDDKKAFSGQGSIVSAAEQQEIYEHGVPTKAWEIADLRDRDRVARRWIDFYHKICNGFEDYLQILDGRVIGDKDGRFQFFLADDGNRGGEDPVTGELLPYYANPDGSGTKMSRSEIQDIDIEAQEGYIRNSIDDILLISRKPYDINFTGGTLTFEFKGTFKEAWRPSPLSRFFPEEMSVYTITTPDRNFKLPGPLSDGVDQSADDQYSFIPDFGNMLADTKKDDILSINVIADRTTRAWLRDNPIDGTTLKIGMKQDLDGQPAYNDSNDGNPQNGWNARYLPEFSKGDIVSLGRTRFNQTSQGTVERDRIIYAQNMRVTSVGSDSITLGKVKKPGKFDVATDPSTLTGGSPANKYDKAIDQPKPDDTVYTSPQNYYQPPIDVGVNQSEGELKNRILPDFIGSLANQNVPPPEQYLDIGLNFAADRRAPRRFPALDGQLVDDGFDNKPPYSYPIQDCEIQSLRREEQAIQRLTRRTTPGIVSQNQTPLDFHTIETSRDTSQDEPPPHLFDALIIEGDKDGSGNSVRYDIRETGTAPFQIRCTAKNSAGDNWIQETVDYDIPNLYDGSGYRDSNNNQRWIDNQGFDFNRISNINNPKAHIGTSTYDISKFDNGFFETASSISESNATFRISGEGQGEVKQDLYSMRDNVDFSEASGTFTIGLSFFNKGTYQIDYGKNGRIYPEVFDSNQVPLGGDVDMSIERGTSIHEGSGQRDTNPSRWNDSSTNFNQWQNVDPLYLNVLERGSNGHVINVHTYRVKEVHDKYLLTESDIQLTGPLYYVLTSNLTYSQGSGAVDPGQHGRLHISSNTTPDQLELESGDTLVIRDLSSQNAGRYQIDNVGSTYVDIESSFRAFEGNSSNNSYPIRWKAYRTRRESAELTDNLRDTLVERYSLYRRTQDASTDPLTSSTGTSVQDLLVSANIQRGNPSTPSEPVLTDLIDDATDVQGRDSNGKIIDKNNAKTLEVGAFDFTTANDSKSNKTDYIIIRNGPNRGFYLLDDIIDPSTVSLKETSLGSEYNLTFASNLVNDSGLEVTWTRPRQMDTRTYELIFYELINALDTTKRIETLIQTTYHDPDDLHRSETIRQHFGNPIASTLDAHRTGSYTPQPIGIEDRRSWIINQHPLTQGLNIRQEVNSILKGRENLYDLRYTWIDFRIHREYGSLVRWNRKKDEQNSIQRRQELDQIKG